MTRLLLVLLWEQSPPVLLSIGAFLGMAGSAAAWFIARRWHGR